jgi:phage terminase large subunit-like protein
MLLAPPVKPSRVLAVEEVNDLVPVYDLTVEGDLPEFFAGGLLVHNCKWRWSRESWYEGIMPSLRADLVGDQPRAFVTTTPKPIKLLQEWLKREDGSIHLMRGSTFDNATNLSAAVLEELRQRYEGTLIGRQELYGEMMDAFEGALFNRLDLENNRVQGLPDQIQNIVVGVDPSLTGEDDEMGVVVVGNTPDRDLWVIADRSVMAVGRAAALHCWRIMHEYNGDMLVYEENLGKRWMREVFEDAYRESCALGMFPKASRPPMKQIDAKTGKRTRAEPVAMRSEQGRLHMIGKWPELEDQMVMFTAWGTNESPDRLDALVHACRFIMAGERKASVVTNPADFSSTLQKLFANSASW